MRSYLIAAAGALFVFWCAHVLVPPNFWVSLSIQPPAVVVIKVGAAVATFVFLKMITAPTRDT